jgi:hypothetical protein
MILQTREYGFSLGELLEVDRTAIDEGLRLLRPATTPGTSG